MIQFWEKAEDGVVVVVVVVVRDFNFFFTETSHSVTIAILDKCTNRILIRIFLHDKKLASASALNLYECTVHTHKQLE